MHGLNQHQDLAEGILKGFVWYFSPSTEVAQDL